MEGLPQGGASRDAHSAVLFRRRGGGPAPRIGRLPSEGPGLWDLRVLSHDPPVQCGRHEDLQAGALPAGAPPDGGQVPVPPKRTVQPPRLVQPVHLEVLRGAPGPAKGRAQDPKGVGRGDGPGTQEVVAASVQGPIGGTDPGGGHLLQKIHGTLGRVPHSRQVRGGLDREPGALGLPRCAPALVTALRHTALRHNRTQRNATQ
mmetsp:Transcript_1966/g.5225  ORF Transcript_1966/g.5225 Transcript_1966/m.5225 type:complete len:203 (-) Transcript_1966:482-1090(-)